MVAATSAHIADVKILVVAVELLKGAARDVDLAMLVGSQVAHKSLATCS